MPADLNVKTGQLDASLRGLRGVAVAFSGGADSALLLAAAIRALPSRQVLAVTIQSPSLASREATAAAEFAAQLGADHVFAIGEELERPEYRANGRDRCAHCKTELMDVMRPLVDQRLGHQTAIVTGTNADDMRDPNRPGIAAARAHGAHTPLADAGFTKQDVRDLSRLWDLPTWDKPQAACLASRIAYGVEVTTVRLRRIDQAEATMRQALSDAGLRVDNLRVRDVGNDVARVELDRALVGDCQVIWPALQALLTEAGFQAAELDPQGFRSGSMNELPVIQLGSFAATR